jgi:hypothetical protein
VYYSQNFVPRLMVKQQGRPDSSLTLPIALTELNGRKDYCFNHTSCTGSGTDRTEYIDLTKHDAITWLGDELYHFRVTAMDGTHCELSTEFMVYVVSPTLNKTVESAIIATTAMLVGQILFLSYLFYVRKNGIRFGD